MTDFLNRALNQTLVYWDFSARDGFGGATFVAPVEISGRWEKKQQMFTTSNGNRLVSSSVIFVGQDVNENDWLFLGSLADIASSIDETNPKNVSEAHQVRAFTKKPTLRADKFQRIVFLTESTRTR